MTASSPDWPRVEGFPQRSEVPAGPKLNLGCGAMILPRAEGWVNADRNAAPGVDVRWDFWTLPWPLASEAFAFVLMCHLAEHIPHEVRGCHEEGWFAVFRELHRILAPGGRVYIVSPYGLSDGAMQDPTHTRFLVPRTFSYFSPQPTPDYQTGYSFRSLSIDLVADPDTLDLEMEHMDPEDVRRLMARQFNVARTLRAILEKA